MTPALLEAIEKECRDARDFIRQYEHVLRQQCQQLDAPAIRVLNANRMFYSQPKAKHLAALTEAIAAYVESRISKLIVIGEEDNLS